ncbi:hypothetical protein Deba_2656 [Desulfarculus baarsii DSM 2075]|uniref:Uncharacterized protein n=1 Tax=Desulfarculus baarsii (strain ATCC 33931 / DSM 2075 / LMG 7858 / VKM B-1802 / 2st14) TaxID=644282 RepID=E1QKB7_DESB2|nr:hypothetical protein [Desulfarculus baarsii]ADK86010.1 hypothetical protein Deba_2656 [Desulfarculus baarsii DSM 2075]
MKGAKGLFKPGVLALLSVAAIAVLLIFAHFDRQAKSLDQLAHQAALQAQAIIAAQAAEAGGQGPALNMADLAAKGWSPPPGVLWELLPGPDGQPRALRLWNPEGVRQYVASAQGVKEGYQ